jgi:hypothetical protein
MLQSLQSILQEQDARILDLHGRLDVLGTAPTADEPEPGPQLTHEYIEQFLISAARADDAIRIILGRIRDTARLLREASGDS